MAKGVDYMNKIVIMFPGQASQYLGMGKYWYDRSDVFRKKFDEASEILGINLKEMCFNGTADELVKTENAQVAIFAVSLAMFEAVQAEDRIAPSYLIGHSLGELSALTASGIFSFEDAIRIARARGEMMAACTAQVETGMTAVTEIRSDEVEEVVKKVQKEGYDVQIANYNTPNQTVLSGSIEALEAASSHLTRMGASVIRLKVSGPFHSKFMKEAAIHLEEVLRPIELGEFSIPVMCTMMRRLYTKDDDIKNLLVQQLISPVYWSDSILSLSNKNISLWLEVGPKNILKNLVRDILKNASVYAYDKDNNESSFKEVLLKIAREEAMMPNFIGLCMGAAVCTRNQNWDQTEYEQGVLKPYKQLQSLFEEVEKEERKPAESELKKSVALLQLIFDTKRVPKMEQMQRLEDIVIKTKTNIDFSGYLELLDSERI